MPAPYSAGSIFLQVVPSFRGVPEQIAREARDWGDRAGKGFDEQFEKQATQSAKKVGKKVTQEMDQAGKDSAEAFGNRFISWADRSKAKEFLKEFEKPAGESGQKAGEQYGGRFATAVKGAVARASKEIGTIKLDADDKELNAKLRQVKRDIEALDGTANIGMDLDVGTVMAKLLAVEENLREIQDRANSIDMRVNSASAMGEVAKVRSELMALSSAQIEPQLKLDRQMGAFERSLKGAIDGALRDLGTVDIGASSDSGKRAVGDLRKQLLELGDQTIGVDISAETARERLNQIRDELVQISSEHWGVDVDANTAAAEANLTAFLTVLDHIDGHHVDIDIDVKDAVSAITVLEGLDRQSSKTSGALRQVSSTGQDGANSFRAFNARVLGVAALGPLVIPALAGIAAGVAAIGPLAAVGAAGIGVLVLGLLNVGQAFKALNASKATSNQDAVTYAKGVETATRQVASAQQSLAKAQTDAARSAEDSSRRVSDAERAVGDARTAAARAAQDAARQVTQAERGVQDAERGLADAQKAAQRAQEDLTQARLDAQNQLDDLNLRLRDSALDQKQAVLDLHQAEKDLSDARASGATGDALAKYEIAYERAKLRIDQTAESAQQLNEEQAKWAKTGVDGSDAVVSAQDRVVSANQGVLDAQRRIGDAQDALTRAQQDQARQATDSARAISDAERSLSDARRDQARQQQDSQAAVAQAQQGINDALDNYSDALAKSSAGQQKLNDAMNALSPTGRAFVQFLDDLRPKMNLLSQLSEEGFLPGLSSWIDAIVNKQGPRLQGAVKGISGALGDMFGRFATSIQGPAFTQLFDMMDRAGPRFIGYMGAVLDNLGTGVASLISAVEPLGDIFGTWFIRISQSFRDWAAGLSGSAGLQSFFEYVSRVGPKIGDFFEQLGLALINIGRSIAPFAEGLLDALRKAFAWIAELDPNTLQKIVLGIGGIVLALQAIFGMTAMVKSVTSALHLMDDVLGRMGNRGPAMAAVGGQLGMFGAGMAVLYSQSSLVRDVVDKVLQTFIDVGKWIAGNIGNFRELATVVGVIAASWKVFSIMGTGAGAISKIVTNSASSVGQWAMGMTNSASAGVKVESAMGKVGSVLGKVGQALPIVGIGFGLVASGIEAVNQHAEDTQKKLDTWVSDLHAGGEKAQVAAGKLADYRQEIQRHQKALDDLSSSQVGAMKGQEGFEQGVAIAEENQKKLKQALQESIDKYNEYWNSLTPIEQAQASLAEAQNNLTTAVRDHGTSSWQARDAAVAYGTAQDKLKQIQYDVATATSGLNQQLQDQLGLMQSLADAELNYDQAASNLEDAHKRAADALAQYGAKSKEYRDALLAEEAAEKSTADAAQRTMEARYSNADATTRQAMGQAAYYLELTRQKELYGELPPRLEQIRASMEKNIDPTVLAAAKFYDLGVQIQSVPNSKEIILDSSTTDAAITKMQDLGLHVEKLPDGTVKVTADTDEAQKIIDDILKPKTLDVTVQVLSMDQANSSFGANLGHNWDAGNAGAPVRKARGGPVWGRGTATSDSIPAYLSNGEYVVRAASVAKYGLPLLDAINHGHYANGGLVRRFKNGLPAFQGGGPVSANWGGTISLSGGNLNPLAGMWFNALQQIGDLSGQAAGMISGAFSQMRDTALGIFTQLRDGGNGIFGQLRDSLFGRSSEARDGTDGIFGQLRDRIFGRTTETRDGANGIFGQLRDWIFGRSNETRDGADGIFGQLRDRLFGKTDETKNGVNARTGQLRDGFLATIGDAVQRASGTWGGLPNFLLGPVNTIIDKVLNNGLFKAFNAIVGALGLDGKLNIPTISPAKLAAGGKVPGWSPHDKADNIPAMLTAGEYVQPVDVVDYYGPDFMEALRKKRIPRQALRYADGGWVAMQNVINKQFPWARITSTYRPGAADYHGQGKAIDIGGSVPYPGGASRQQMLLINRWIADNFRNITELIHTDTGAINLWHGQPHTYNAATQAEHRNHVHWAMANGLDGSGGGGFLATLGQLLGVGTDLISDPAGFLKSTVDKALDGFGGNPVKDIMAAGARKAVGWAVDKVTGFMGSLFGSGDGSQTDFTKTMSGTVAEQVRQVFANYGWGGGAPWADASWVIQHESGFNPKAQNPSSTASGIGQFIDATWRSLRPAGAEMYAHMKDAPVAMQADATARYMKKYGGPSGTKAFWQAHHWYADGGPVQDIDSASGMIVPDLHDTGGWLQPGLNVIMNRTGRPEPTINPQTLEALQSIAAGGDTGGGDTINLGVMNGASAREVVSEINHARTVASRGGKY